MRIGILTGEEFAFGHYGGFGYVARKTANLLKKIGHDICLIDTSPQYGKNRAFLEGIPVCFLKNKKFKLRWIEELIVVKNFVKRVPLDVIISIEPSRWTYYFKRVCPETKSLVWFQDVRTIDDWKKIFTNPFVVKPDFFWTKYKLEMFLRKLAVEKSEKLIAQAELIKGKVKETYDLDSDAVDLLRNPILIPEEKSVKKDGTPLVIFLGRLDPIKRPWIFAEVSKQFPNIQFRVLGITHFPLFMDSVIKKYRNINNLKFLGLVTGKKKADILSRAWILINTSVYESLPVSFLEALSYKMAILSCHNPDNITSTYGFFTGEILGDGINETVKFEDGLCALISNDVWRRKGEQGYEFVRKIADEKIVYARLQEILSNFNRKID